MGQVLAGRFELLEHVASGASGAIWRAVDRRRQAECAAKVLRQKDSGELLRFVREQGIRLEHPHLATPYGWAAEDNDVAIAMPLVRGGTLESSLSGHGPFTPALVSVLLLQLLQALAFVHEAGWLHRDVKPANILLEPTGTGRPHLRLGDFGIALRTDEPRFTQLGMVHGTPGYYAPEVAHGAPPSAENDLYAAGVVALRMLDPGIKTLEAVADAKRRLPHAPLPELLRDTIVGLTSDNPTERRRAAEWAPHRLAELAAGESFRVASGELFEVFDQLPQGLGDGQPDLPPVQQLAPGPDATVRRRPAVPAPTPADAPTEVGMVQDHVATVRTSRARTGPLVVIGLGLLLVVAAMVMAWLT